MKDGAEDIPYEDSLTYRSIIPRLFGCKTSGRRTETVDGIRTIDTLAPFNDQRVKVKRVEILPLLLFSGSFKVITLLIYEINTSFYEL